MGAPETEDSEDFEGTILTDMKEGDKELKLCIGMHVDILDSVQRWSEAEILKLDIEHKRIYITYLYWDDKWNEWISFSDGRIASLHTHTYHSGGVLKVGQRIECKDSLGKWIESFIIEDADDQIKVHYKGFAQKFDEWIPRTALSRIRPYGLTKPVAGRKGVARTWSVPGTIDQENDKRTRQITELSNKYDHYLATLRSNGLAVAPVAGDGNCLFRAVSHQVYGDDSFHHVVREKCMDYMEVDAAFFSQYVEGGLAEFGRYLDAKRCNACWGDDPEIQAICELYDRPAEIWAYDSTIGARKLRTFHEAAGSSRLPPMRLSYYGGGHFDSILPISDRITTEPGVVENRSIQSLRHRLLLHSGEARFNIASSTSAIESEEAAVELAVQRSRQDLADWGDQDLQQTLALSVLEAGEQEAYLQMVGDEGGVLVPDTSATGELLAVQGELLRTVAEQSEREFIEKAIQDSIIASELGGSVEDEELLLQARLASMAEREQREVSEREELARALELSAFQTDDGLSAEDSMIQAALQESLSAISNADYHETNFVSTSFQSDSDDELELRRAIEESLRLAS